jgi:hypothetical protein
MNLLLNPKAEGRNPKEGRRPKSEAEAGRGEVEGAEKRREKTETEFFSALADGVSVSPLKFPLRPSTFFRPSGFFRISAFGLGT